MIASNPSCKAKHGLAAVGQESPSVNQLCVFRKAILPAIVISGFFGMNTKGMPWVESPHATGIAAGLMIIITVALLVLLKKFDWF